MLLKCNHASPMVAVTSSPFSLARSSSPLAQRIKSEEVLTKARADPRKPSDDWCSDQIYAIVQKQP